MPIPDRLAAALRDRYTFERELGAGGMATVHLATDRKHGRHVAVKVLDPALAASVGADRFLREVRITAGLQHPHILTLIDSGEADGFLFYVMPYVAGESLRQRLQRAAGPLAVPEAVRIFRETVDALAHAHRHGLVHRDVKPENVMLSEGHALVLDFGVAKAVQAARGRDDAGEAPDHTAGRTGTLTSVGTSLGTPAYMSPEQAAGDPQVDHRADIYSAGVVAYEMLAGRAPFEGRPQEVMAQHVTVPPRPLADVAPQVPAPLARLVMQCLEKRPEARPESADAVLEALDSLTPRAGDADARAGRGRRGLRIGTLVAVSALLASAGWWQTARSRQARWAREVAVPEIERLLDASQTDSAFDLYQRAIATAPDEPALGPLASRVSRDLLFVTDPPGARLRWTSFADSAGWRDGGSSPATLSLPAGVVRIRVERPGSRPVERLLGGGGRLRLVGEDSVLRLEPDDAPHAEMVQVAGGRVEVAMPGLSNLAPAALAAFRIDRAEVTNAEFKRFVDAGGYARREFWTEPIRSVGRVLSFEESRALFVDRTGRPGPAGWEAGDIPAGAEDLPVGGVSWYEAAAYAAFSGKSLPTVYHWNRAAGVGAAQYVVRGSNLAARGPRPASRFSGMSPSGAYDMAGNVREWVFNEFGTQRFILGGGWLDQHYAFVDAYAQDPIDRSPINGIRLMERVGDDAVAQATQVKVVREHRDYAVERPVGDAVYRGLVSTFDYDRTPFDLRAESRDTTGTDWDVETVSIATAYGRDRLPVYLFIPRRAVDPMQAVVYFPGSNAFFERSVNGLPASLEPVVKSGRIVVWPVYAGTYEREHSLASDAPNESAAYRDHMVMWVKDLRRTVDYLATRPDVDSSRIAYLGISFGGRVAPVMLAMEPRFRTGVLFIAGLKMERTRPEADPLNFLPRVRMPVLMLNGRYDHYFPLESSQLPFFRLLGTPPADKRHVVSEGGHQVPRTVVIGETLAWLDKYLGPVTLRGR